MQSWKDLAERPKRNYSDVKVENIVKVRGMGIEQGEAFCCSQPPKVFCQTLLTERPMGAVMYTGLEALDEKLTDGQVPWNLLLKCLD